MDYHFVFATGGTIPAGAQPNGNEANGDPLWVARSPGATDPFFFHGGIHPGKVRPGFGAALIPFGGNEEPVPDYEVLVEARDLGGWLRRADSRWSSGLRAGSERRSAVCGASQPEWRSPSG